jgi:O-antigen ligase
MVQTGLKSAKSIYLLCFSLVLVDLLYWIAVDPLNPFKLSAMGIVAAIASGEILSSPQLPSAFNLSTTFRTALLLLSLFLLFFVVAFIRTPVKLIGLVGDSNRNLGFLNYLFLTILALYSILKISYKNVHFIYYTAIGLGALLGVYGLFQHFHIDFVPWSNIYNPIILFTGNPDFASSLLSILCIFVCAMYFYQTQKVLKILLFGLFMFLLVIIYWSQARQGLVGLAIGVGLIFFVTCWQKSRMLAIGLLIIEGFGVAFSVLGTLQIGPLTHYFYKASITDRGYNWNAAVEMFKAHPWFGVGVDSYRSFFFQYQSPKYPLIYGYNQLVNNSHNVFLELFATCGVFVGFTYLLWIIFVGTRAFRIIRDASGSRRVIATGIVAAWLVYVAQSAISIDVQVLSIWGWILGGSIVGLSLNRENQETEKIFETAQRSPKRIKNRSIKSKDSNFMRVLVTFVLLIPALSLAVLVSQNEVRVLKFLDLPTPTTDQQRQDYIDAARNALQRPLLSPGYKLKIVMNLARNGNVTDTVKYLPEIIKEDPRDANSLVVYATVLENLRRFPEAIAVRKKLVAVYPHGAENLVSLEFDYVLTGDRHAATATKQLVVDMAPGTDVASRATKILDQQTPIPKK